VQAATAGKATARAMRTANAVGMEVCLELLFISIRR
jgi:hypothetical protein